MNWEAIRQEWESTSISLNAIAAKYDVKPSTLKSRKVREKWEKQGNVTPAKAVKAVKERIEKRVEKVEIVEAPRVVNVPSKKPRNKGKLKPSVNSPWLKHLPEETLELIEEMELLDPLDVLYDQIRLQWAMIVRSQEIMFVMDREDTTKFISTNGAESTGYDIHAAWDKQGKFMTSMTAAQKELRYLIQQFMDLVPVDDERRARVANIEANTELVKERTKLLQGNTKDPSMLNVLIEAMQGGQS